ncbi:hypothetical protein JM654_23630 [Microbacterium oxydans]|nr:hypothetical protein [Microbacterium oxydans]
MSFDDFELAELSPVPISVIDHDPPRARPHRHAPAAGPPGRRQARQGSTASSELPVSLRGVR